MSLPNDDDQNGRQPWRKPFGHQNDTAISPTKKLTVASNNADDRTADETSIGSMSFSSDITSVVATGTNIIPATPLRQRPARDGPIDTPMSALTANTSDDASIQSGVSFNTEDGAARQLRRQRNRIQLQRLGAATGATFSLFLYMLVPTALLLSMILFGSVSSVFLYQLGTIMRWEFHRSILEGRGIGDYIPQSVYDMLTSTSLHDFLSDPNGIFGASEHLPYLMLYLIPGLTQEQLDQYISRLNPAHQRLLRSEQGLMGFLMNRNNHRLANTSDSNQDSTLMRFIMGDERLREWRQQQDPPQHHPSSIAPRRLELPPTIPEEELSTELSREEARIENSSESTGIPATVDTAVGRAAVPPTADGSSQPPPIPVPQSPERRPSDSGEMILFDALGSAVASFVGDATNTVRERAQETFRETLGIPIYRVSLGVTALGLGVGALGLATGTYDLQSLAQPIGQFFSNFVGSLLGSSSSGSRTSSSGPWVRLSLTMPSDGVLVGSTIASGTTAVLLGLFGTTRSSSSSTTTRGGDGEAPKTIPAATTTSTNGNASSKG